VLFTFVLPVGLAAQAVRYEDNWESLDKRPSPQWFDDAKFGIFVLWGLYSVPAYAPPAPTRDTAYAETYWLNLAGHRGFEKDQGPTLDFHRKIYGADFRYQDFVPEFTAKLFNPDQWASLFVQSGGRYVVFTAKYNDGYALWPSPESRNWNSVDLQPHPDLVGELSKAVVAQGLKMGFYYNLREPFNPLYTKDIRAYVEQHMIPQLKDLVMTYHPSILWPDWPGQPSSVYESTKFLTWLFNDSPAKDAIVVNDRWGTDTGSRHGGFYTSEYGHSRAGKQGPAHKWEENQGIGKSYGFNRMEGASDYKSATKLIHLLVDTVSNGGNLLLDVGPTADGRIPVIMQERLLQMGAWLKVNGEAIYETRPWRQISEGAVRYTSKGNAVYAIAETWPKQELVLTAPRPTAGTTVTLLGREGPLKWRRDSGNLRIEVPSLSRAQLDMPDAYVFKLTEVD
jgi:alpha-L-fucosidase